MEAMGPLSGSVVSVLDGSVSAVVVGPLSSVEASVSSPPVVPQPAQSTSTMMMRRARLRMPML
jgi:hypothetical protein